MLCECMCIHVLWDEVFVWSEGESGQMEEKSEADGMAKWLRYWTPDRQVCGFELLAAGSDPPYPLQPQGGGVSVQSLDDVCLEPEAANDEGG